MKASSATMAVDGLLAVGGILSLALGVSGLILVNNQKLEVIWNKRFAAQLLCWIFICKGVANSLRSIGYENEFWRVVLYGGHFNDQIFAGLILMIALIFPVPILRSCRSRLYSPDDWCSSVHKSQHTIGRFYWPLPHSGFHLDVGLFEIPVHERPRRQ